jgi:hypothetical protein
MATVYETPEKRGASAKSNIESEGLRVESSINFLGP